MAKDHPQEYYMSVKCCAALHFTAYVYLSEKKMKQDLICFHQKYRTRSVRNR